MNVEREQYHELSYYDPAVVRVGVGRMGGEPRPASGTVAGNAAYLTAGAEAS